MFVAVYIDWSHARLGGIDLDLWLSADFTYHRAPSLYHVRTRHLDSVTPLKIISYSRTSSPTLDKSFCLNPPRS